MEVAGEEGRRNAFPKGYAFEQQARVRAALPAIERQEAELLLPPRRVQTMCLCIGSGGLRHQPRLCGVLAGYALEHGLP